MESTRSSAEQQAVGKPEAQSHKTPARKEPRPGSVPSKPASQLRKVHPQPGSETREQQGGSDDQQPSKPKDESTEVKELRQKYSNELNTLKGFVVDWSDEDLLFTIQECNGDLELAYSRINDGYAQQWGEVKNRKTKREEQKTKPVEPSVPKTAKPKETPDRKDKGRGSKDSTARRPAQKPRSGGDTAVRTKESNRGPDGSQRPDAKGEPTKPPSADPRVAAPAAQTVQRVASNGSQYGRPGQKITEAIKPPKPVSSGSSWASVVRTHKPTTASLSTQKPSESLFNESDLSKIVSSSLVRSSQVEAPLEPRLEQAPQQHGGQAGPSLFQTMGSSALAGSSDFAEGSKEPATQTISPPPGFKKPSSSNRLLNQDAAVIMPGSSTSLEKIGLQFGTLSLSPNTTVDFPSNVHAEEASSATIVSKRSSSFGRSPSTLQGASSLPSAPPGFSKPQSKSVEAQTTSVGGSHSQYNQLAGLPSSSYSSEAAASKNFSGLYAPDPRLSGLYAENAGETKATKSAVDASLTAQSTQSPRSSAAASTSTPVAPGSVISPQQQGYAGAMPGMPGYHPVYYMPYQYANPAFPTSAYGQAFGNKNVYPMYGAPIASTPGKPGHTNAGFAGGNAASAQNSFPSTEDYLGQAGAGGSFYGQSDSKFAGGMQPLQGHYLGSNQSAASFGSKSSLDTNSSASGVTTAPGSYKGFPAYPGQAPASTTATHPSTVVPNDSIPPNVLAANYDMFYGQHNPYAMSMPFQPTQYGQPPFQPHNPMESAASQQLAGQQHAGQQQQQQQSQSQSVLGGHGAQNQQQASLYAQQHFANQRAHQQAYWNQQA